jgi:hypothetical protein
MLYESLKKYGYPIEKLHPTRQQRLKFISERLQRAGVSEIPQEAVSLLLGFHSLNESEMKALEMILFEETDEDSKEEQTSDQPKKRKFSLVEKNEWWTNWGRTRESGRVLKRDSLISATRIAREPEVVWRELGAPRVQGKTLTQQTASLLAGLSGQGLGGTLRNCYGQMQGPIVIEQDGKKREVILFEDKNAVGNNLGVFVKLALVCAQAVGSLDTGVAIASGDAPRDTDVVVRNLLEAEPLREAAPALSRFVGNYVLISVRADLK